jgi:hypothetical protein
MKDLLENRTFAFKIDVPSQIQITTSTRFHTSRVPLLNLCCQSTRRSIVLSVALIHGYYCRTRGKAPGHTADGQTVTADRWLR